jgi:hypothetical protein
MISQVTTALQVNATTGNGEPLFLREIEVRYVSHHRQRISHRASFDAVTVVAALLGVLAFAPPWHRLKRRHWWTGALVVALTALFFTMLARSLHHAEERARPGLERLEREGPR